MELFEYIKSGPVRPATSYKTTTITDCVKIRYVSGSSHAVAGIDDPPVTIPELFSTVVKKYASLPAVVHKDSNNVWHTVTYREYYEQILHVAKHLIALGIDAYDSVGIIAASCPEWCYAELGSIFVGANVAGIYTTNSPDAVHHALNLCNAKAVFVDDHEQMEKILAIKDRLPNLRYAIQFYGPYDQNLFDQTDDEETDNGEAGESSVKFLKWKDFVRNTRINWDKLYEKEHGNGYNDAENEENNLNEQLLMRLNAIAPNQTCLLIFTSGTVGYPKAVMLSHDNLITNCRKALLSYPNVCYGDERTVSYLPLSHIAAQVFDIFILCLMGGAMYIADKDAMKGSLMKTIAKAKPTRFFGVPRVFEKMQDKISLMEKQNYGFLLAILNWAKHYASDYHLSIMKGSAPKYGARYWCAQNILTCIKTVLGLEKCRYIITGGAPISEDIKQFFLDYDIRLYEVYGLSETSGGVAFGDEQIKDFNAKGRPVDGVQFKVLQPNEEGYGEICLKSRSNFMGYLNEPLKTDETLDVDGWMHSGDLGCLDEHGYLYITGRIKEIVITSGGENIPPYHVENLIKAQLPGLNNVFLVGDRRKYLTVLVTIKTELNPETGVPLDNLHTDALLWVRSLDLKYSTLSEILKAGPCSKVQYAIADGIKRANMQAISNAQKVQKFRILSSDFSLATGELGPTLKVKRNFVLDKYTTLIDEMYKE